MNNTTELKCEDCRKFERVSEFYIRCLEKRNETTPGTVNMSWLFNGVNPCEFWEKKLDESDLFFCDKHNRYYEIQCCNCAVDLISREEE